MKNSISLKNESSEELTDLINENIKSQMQDFMGQLNNYDHYEILTREETFQYLKIDSSTLSRWTNKGKVVIYGIGGRRYYKKAELFESLIPLKKVS